MIIASHYRVKSRSVFAAAVVAATMIGLPSGDAVQGQSSSISLVQHAGKDSGVTTSSSLAFTSNNTAGNFIAVAVRAGRSNQAFTVADSRGNSYRPAVQLNVTVDAPLGDTLALFYTENIAAGANTVTVTSSLSQATLRFAILEYSGVALANSIQASSSAQGTNASPATGSLSAGSGDLLLGAVMSADGRTFTAGNGFTIRDRVPAAPGTKLIVEDRNVATTGAVPASATMNSSNPWGAIGAVFRAGSATPRSDLTLSKTHSGSFVRGQDGANYTVVVSNVGSAATSGNVSVTDTLPGGLIAAAISGAGWNCSLSTLICSRADVLGPGASYPPIALNVNVSASAPSSVANTATVSGGGDANTGNNVASDPTTIVSTPPTDTQLPSAPGSLVATAAGIDRIDLRWNASSDNVGVTGYIVEQCQGSGCASFTEIARVEGGQTSASSIGPLSASNNPNYFKDGSGKPLILAGSHTWNNLQDWGTGGSLQTLDFYAYVDFLVAHGHNFTLLWYIELPKFCGFPTTTGTPPDFSVGPHPWQRTGPGSATDGGPKFDLTKFNQAYFDRLRARVEALDNAGIYAGVYVFTAEWVGRYRCATDGYPFTGTNNINGINDGGGSGSFTMTSPNAITAIQDLYVEKVIDTLNDLRNVVWIVSEEAPTNSSWWNRHQIAHIRSYQAGKPVQHPIGYGVLADLQDPEVVNSDADWIAPGAWESPTTTCGSGTPRCKVNINDSDHSFFGLWNSGVQQHRAFVWQNFVKGNQAVFMDPYVLYYSRENRNTCVSPNQGICAEPHSRYDNFRDNFGYILRYSRKLNLSAVTPRSSLCSTSYCLAQTPSVGAEYLIYAPNGGNFTVNLSAMSSSRMLNVEWFNPSTGATTAASPIPAGSSSRSFTPPFSGDAVLYLVDSAGHAGSTTLATAYTVTDLPAGAYGYRVRAIDAAGNMSAYSNVASATVQSPDTAPPSAPTDLAATAGPGQISLTWTASIDEEGVAGYVVQRCQGAGCTTFSQIATPSGTSFVDIGLPSSTSFTYRVRATDTANNPGPWSSAASATTPQSSGGISLLQARSLDAGSATSSALAFPSGNFAGNFIVVAVRSWPVGQTLTVTDVRGNVYRRAVQLNETVDGMTLAIYYAENIVGGSNTVTVSNSISNGTLRFAIFEYAGVARANSLVGTAVAQGSSATPATAETTPTAPSGLGIGVIATANARTFTAGTGYRLTEQVPASPLTKLMVEDWIEPPPGSLSAGASLSASDVWGAVAAVFRAEP